MVCRKFKNSDWSRVFFRKRKDRNRQNRYYLCVFLSIDSCIAKIGKFPSVRLAEGWRQPHGAAARALVLAQRRGRCRLFVAQRKIGSRGPRAGGPGQSGRDSSRQRPRARYSARSYGPVGTTQASSRRRENTGQSGSLVATDRISASG